MLIGLVVQKTNRTTCLQFYLQCRFIDFKARNQIRVVFYSDLCSTGCIISVVISVSAFTAVDELARSLGEAVKSLFEN